MENFISMIVYQTLVLDLVVKNLPYPKLRYVLTKNILSLLLPKKETISSTIEKNNYTIFIMIIYMQLTHLFPTFDALQKIYGEKTLDAIYGCGKIDKPKVCLVFMNPTARNAAANKQWK